MKQGEANQNGTEAAVRQRQLRRHCPRRGRHGRRQRRARPAYGEDEWTRRACDLLREFFETNCEVFFAFTARRLTRSSVATLCEPYHSIIVQENRPPETDECGAARVLSNGTKVLLVPGADGKLDLPAVEHTSNAGRTSTTPSPAP